MNVKVEYIDLGYLQNEEFHFDEAETTCADSTTENEEDEHEGTINFKRGSVFSLVVVFKIDFPVI